eukprot:TRINITY_DN3540_c0_g1_i1.p1 TRINITY_DN3540_c0_g1~~TRINITY_DN3540_c0_g1_i1.p1  ORF type:complete len:81 (-),score=7.29 TRINITY_DN3540_c0_g1_i1:71-313(-)
MDEALAEQLNTFEIDINMKRIETKSGKVLYRYNGRRHLVRFIHGVLLVRKTGYGLNSFPSSENWPVWTELINDDATTNLI